MTGRILTCVYCGHEYPQDTPAFGSDILTEHIKVCEQHPLRKAEQQISVLRSALVGLLGVDGKNDLIQMKTHIQNFPDTEPNKAVSLNAINALLDTTNKNQRTKNENIQR
jgi:hypothetical protein